MKTPWHRLLEGASTFLVSGAVARLGTIAGAPLAKFGSIHNASLAIMLSGSSLTGQRHSPHSFVLTLSDDDRKALTGFAKTL